MRTFDESIGGTLRQHRSRAELTAYGTIPSPVVSLTIQAALPGTLLADGETIPSPGQSVIVKLFNDNTPNDAGAPIWLRTLRVDGHRRR